MATDEERADFIQTWCILIFAIAFLGWFSVRVWNNSRDGPDYVRVEAGRVAPVDDGKPADMPAEMWGQTTARFRQGANLNREDAETAARAVWKFEQARQAREGR